MQSTNQALARRFGPRFSNSKSLVKGQEDQVIGKRRGEGTHTAYFWSRCVLEELYRLWPREYNNTIRSVNTKNNVQHKTDFTVTTHAAMFLEDLGLGRNDAKVKITATHHTNGGRCGANLDRFVRSICNHARRKDVDWLQVQGDGVSDEYIAETNEARGDMRFAWQALSEAMWPKPSPAEKLTRFGGDGVYDGMQLQEHGNALCAESV
jgi:hypothetical protein